MSDIATGLCRCGCGRYTAIAPRSDKRKGWVKGQPLQFVRGHYVRELKPVVVGGYRNSKSNGRSVEVHRLVAEAALGKPLPQGVEVHHVDENKSNNANTNLVICQDRTYHKLLHVRARVLRAGGNPNTERICCRCKRLRRISTGFYRGNNQCRECWRAINRARNQRVA